MAPRAAVKDDPDPPAPGLGAPPARGAQHNPGGLNLHGTQDFSLVPSTYFSPT